MSRSQEPNTTATSPMDLVPESSPTLDFTNRLSASPVLPIWTPSETSLAPRIARAISAGGLRFLEITLRTADALTAISGASGNGLTIGAGTVLTVNQARAAVDAGAQFIVSPGLDTDVVRACQSMGVPIAPGISTPTELMAARSLGIELAKVFPARELGGPDYIRALSAAFPGQLLLPTGGVTSDSATEYLSIPSVVAVGGSWIVPPAAVAAQDWDVITGLAKAAATLASDSR